MHPLEPHYYSLSKTASYAPLLAASGLGLGLGALYGIGDRQRNYTSELFHSNVGERAIQGMGTGLSGVSAYKALRNLGLGKGKSGLLGLAAGTIANRLLQPTTKKYSPYNLYRSQ
jgi:hypothetical protein